jgi:hypothetical protein
MQRYFIKANEFLGKFSNIPSPMGCPKIILFKKSDYYRTFAEKQLCKRLLKLEVKFSQVNSNQCKHPPFYIFVSLR